MRYILLLYQDETGFWFRLSDAERAAEGARYEAFARALGEAGQLVAAERFEPYYTARTVRRAGDRPAVGEGAYADTPEQLGGAFIIEVADEEEALAWAARCPTIGHGVVEIRRLWQPPAAPP
ncbi:YciI family protein [Bauldia litoralis]|uniref:Uncharacterized conserved protein n=1 Tax=Bauldia litoralis TaxID=665467 RepID=A0A1G6DFU1_9HYPH|nr:YciI family protein [Bauldia litoralis]SDB43979.1 Uncharacterized conserved protein [Bauldia litoralis]